MRKEFIYAIIIGGILGLIVAFGVWRVNSALSPNKNLNNVANDQDDQNKNSAITIAEPGSNAVVSTPSVKITGIAKPDARVIISGEETDYLASLDNKGAFSLEVDLTGGINQITAAAIDDKGNLKKEILLVIYSSEFAKITPPVNEGAKESTGSTDAVRQKVDQVVNSPTSYLGTVTDIAANSIQLKSPTGEIKQVSTQAIPTVIKDGKVVKEVKLADVAIGDFIVAMGFRNGNHVLDARRILITSQPETPNKEYLLGRVTKNTKGKVSFTNIKSGQETALTTATAATIYLKRDSDLSKIKFANLSENDLFVAVGKFSSDKFEAQTLFVIERP